MYLKNKKALVTGGGGGLGWGICLELAKEGAQVIVTDINEESGQNVLKEVQKISSGHTFETLDVRNIAQFDNFINKHADIDILVNNAGINTSHSFLDMDEKNWDDVFNTNLKGHFFLSQKISQNMIKKQIKGNVIFISSVHQKIYQARPHYVATKAAIARVVKELAVELAPHTIRVNGVAPGGIYINERIDDPYKANDEKTVILRGKNGIPQDVARTTIFLASDYWSRHITGEIITVSGGQYLKPVIK